MVKQSADTRLFSLPTLHPRKDHVFPSGFRTIARQGVITDGDRTDDYFIDREHTPKDENGEYDFESLRALNIEKLNDDLKRLINGEEVQLPRYNFKTGLSERGSLPAGKGSDVDSGRHTRLEPRSAAGDSRRKDLSHLHPALPS